MKKFYFILTFFFASLFATNAQENQISDVYKFKQTPIKVSDLPEIILNDIEKHYPGSIIHNAFVVENNKKNTYGMQIAKGFKLIEIFYEKSQGNYFLVEGTVISKSLAEIAETYPQIPEIIVKCDTSVKTQTTNNEKKDVNSKKVFLHDITYKKPVYLAEKYTDANSSKTSNPKSSYSYSSCSNTNFTKSNNNFIK